MSPASLTCEHCRALVASAAGGLDRGPADAAAVAAHVAGCAACAAEERAFERVVARLESALATPAAGPSDAELAARVIAALPAGRVVDIAARRRRASVAAGLAAAALVGVAYAAWRGGFAGAQAPRGPDIADASYPLAPPPADDWAGPRFTDVTADSGIRKLDHTGTPARKDWMVEVVGHGAAVLDMDGDGDMDLFVPDGNRIDPGERVADTWRLYRNDGALHFTDVTAQSGLASDAWAGGAVAGDVDGDGHTDLFVPCFGRNRLYLGRGDGTFVETAERAGVAGRDDEWSTAAAFGDIDGDGDLDLYVANYADMRRYIHEAPGGRGCKWRTMDVPCGPQPLLPLHDRLYVNRGDGTFEDATEERLPASTRYSFQPLLADFDGDGSLDIFVAADGQPNLLLVNDGSGRFEDHARDGGVATDVDGREQACMGAALGDVDGDGLPDLLVTNFSHEPNVLYRSRRARPGQPVFSDITRAAGVDRASFFTLGWGSVFADLDCDGDLDAVVANGHLYPGVEEVVPSTAYEQHLSVLANGGDGRFTEVTAAAGGGVGARRVHRGLLAADFDDDGREDLFATVLNGPAVLLRNDGRGAGNFVRLVLRRAGGHVEAAGARAIVRAGSRTVVRDLLLGSSFGSSEDPRLLVGLADAPGAELEVRWPRRAGADAVIERFGRLEAGATYEVVEGTGVARRVR